MNRQIRLKARPQGRPGAEHFELAVVDIPEPCEGGLVVHNLYASLDPAMRGWIRDVRTYVEPVPIGGVMRAITVGRVVKSNSPDVPVGAYVRGILGLQDYAAVAATDIERIDPAIAPLTAYCGGLGMTGQTAYFGLLEVGRPQSGETVLVSSAAGATGSVVGQIAKLHGCRVVGIAGGPEKKRFVQETLGFDEAIDYREGSLPTAIRAACPQGVDIYFDNVGGETLDAALLNMARNGRVVLCGAMSQIDRADAPGVKNLLQLAFARARMEGFIVYEYKSRFAEATQQLAAWLKQGKLVLPEQVMQGIERFPEALGILLEGKKLGKLVLQIADDGVIAQ